MSDTQERDTCVLVLGGTGRTGGRVVEADLLALTDEELARLVSGCDAAISCLGHNLNLKGIYAPPRDQVAEATRRVCRANQSEGADTRRGAFEKGFVALIRGLLPPARDNQRASDFLCGEIGSADPFVEWVAVRPDTLPDGDVTQYAAHEQLVSSLFKADETNMSNVAHSCASWYRASPCGPSGGVSCLSW